MTVSRFLHPAGRYTSGARIAAADRLREALAERGIDVDLIDAGYLVELVADSLHGGDAA